MRSLIFRFSFFTELWWLSLAPMSAGHLIICFWRCISVVIFLLFPLSVSVNFIILGFNWRPLWGDGGKKVISWTKLLQGLMVFIVFRRKMGYIKILKTMGIVVLVCDSLPVPLEKFHILPVLSSCLHTFIYLCLRSVVRFAVQYGWCGAHWIRGWQERSHIENFIKQLPKWHLF